MSPTTCTLGLALAISLAPIAFAGGEHKGHEGPSARTAGEGDPSDSKAGITASDLETSTNTRLTALLDEGFYENDPASAEHAKTHISNALTGLSPNLSTK